MTAYIIRRLLQTVLVLFIVTFYVFMILHILPGDPLMLYISQSQMGSLAPEQLEALRHEFGLDKPIPTQYVDWIGGVFGGNLGSSIFLGDKVLKLVAESLPITVHLGITAMLIACILGIASGVICALRRGKWLDTMLTVLANAGITIPNFWAGILLIYLFGLKLGWLPIFGYTSPFDDFSLSTRQMLMPVFCLSLFGVAALTRQTRSSMLEVVRQDYIRTAWAKGLSERVVVLRHTLKNALIPIVTLLGMQVRFLVGGSVVIETVFSIPGMGRLLVEAIFAHDYQVVQGCVLIIAIVVAISNLIVDISYAWLDPRIRYD